MKFSFFLRSRLIVFFVILFAGAITARLFWVQVVHGDYYSGEAARQYVAGRGISPESVEQFGIGLTPDRPGRTPQEDRTG